MCVPYQPPYGKRARVADPPCSDPQRSGFSNLLRKNLDKGNTLYTHVLESQKKLLTFHKDEEFSSTRSPLIRPPHWSPAVPSSSPEYASAKFPMIKSSPCNQYDTPSESLPNGVESYNSPATAVKTNQPSLQFQEPGATEAALACLLLNVGNGNNNADHHEQQDLEFPPTAALPFIQPAEEKVYPPQKGKAPKDLEKSGRKNPFIGDGMEAAASGSPQKEEAAACGSPQKEEAAVTEADIASALELGEEDLDLLTTDSDGQIALSLQTRIRRRNVSMFELDNLVSQLMETNRKVSESLVDLGNTYVG